MNTQISSVTHREWTDPDTGKYVDKYDIYYKTNRRRTIGPGYQQIPTTVLDFILNAKTCKTEYHMMQKRVTGKIFSSKVDYYHN